MTKKILIIISLFVFSIYAFAENREISLNECIEISLHNHPDLKYAKEDKKSSLANYRIAQSLSKPKVSGQIRTTQNDNPNDGNENYIKVPGDDKVLGMFVGLTATYNLYDATKNEIELSARYGVDISKFETKKTIDNVVLNVKNKFYEYQMFLDTILLRKKLLVKYKKKLKLAKALFVNGLRPLLDVNTAEVDYTNSQFEYEKAKELGMVKKLELLSAMGIDNVQLSINPEKEDNLVELKCSLDDLYRLSDIYYPEKKIIQLRKKIAKVKIAIERAANYPNVNFLASAGFENEYLQKGEGLSENTKSENWNQIYLFGISAALPLYSGGAVSAKVDKAISEYNKMVYQEKKILMGIKNSIKLKYNSLKNVLTQIEMSRLMIKNTKKRLLLVQRSYENGVVSMLELQDAEMGLIRSQLRLLDLKNVYLKTRADLSRMIGVREVKFCK